MVPEAVMSRLSMGAALGALVILSGCQAREGVAGAPSSPSSAGAPMHVFAGRLTDARCYLNTSAVGGDHEYCAFMSARADLPLIFLPDSGGYFFVTNRPSALATVVTKHVVVEAQQAKDQPLLRIATIREAASGRVLAVAP
jgi:hypothetical protein